MHGHFSYTPSAESSAGQNKFIQYLASGEEPSSMFNIVHSGSDPWCETRSAINSQQCPRFHISNAGEYVMLKLISKARTWLWNLEANQNSHILSLALIS